MGKQENDGEVFLPGQIFCRFFCCFSFGPDKSWLSAICPVRSVGSNGQDAISLACSAVAGAEAACLEGWNIKMVTIGGAASKSASGNLQGTVLSAGEGTDGEVPAGSLAELSQQCEKWCRAHGYFTICGEELQIVLAAFLLSDDSDSM